jgi:hypothetical protein
VSEVFWKRSKPDPDGAVWNDLRDLTVKLGIRGWVITYRDYFGTWHVMWNPKIFNNRQDQLINQATTSEEKLRNDLKLYYLLTKGET